MEGKDGQPIIVEPAIYRSLFILEALPTSDEQPKTLDKLDKMVDAFKDLPDADLKPAVGVLTVHEQSWEQKGLALGNLLQSVCLAPGEVTQVAVTRWERKTTATSTELTEQSESVSSQAEQDRAVNEVQRSVAQEQQYGSSSTSASSTSSQAGASYGLFGLGASASRATTSSSVLTAQFSAGNRSIAAESTNNISQRTAEHSQALRSRRQSVVREVSEKESEELSTRVLANYNRRHTLNILFFEVLQLYRIQTQLKDWERCLFVPMSPVDFVKDKSAIRRHLPNLLSIFSELGPRGMVEFLGTRALENQEENARKEVSAIDLQLTQLKEGQDCATKFAWAKTCFDSDSAQIEELQVQIRDKTPAPHGRDATAARQRMLTHLQTALPVKKKESEEATTKWSEMHAARPWLPEPVLFPRGYSLEPFKQAMDTLMAKRMEVVIPVAELLNQNRLFLSQQLWLRMSPYRVYRILQQYQIDGQPLANFVDPQPVGVFGCYVAFRWRFENAHEREQFRQKYLTENSSAFEKIVGLPTSGVFAEAVLGKGLAAEDLDEKRFGKWSDKDNMIPILPPKIADLTSRDRHHDIDLEAKDFAANLATLRAAALADVSHIDKAIAAAVKGDSFRDMGGLKEAVSLATELGKLSAAGAKDAAEQATKIQLKLLETFKEVISSEAGQASLKKMMGGNGDKTAGKPAEKAAK